MSAELFMCLYFAFLALVLLFFYGASERREEERADAPDGCMCDDCADDGIRLAEQPTDVPLYVPRSWVA